jgi:hypothetical protein
MTDKKFALGSACCLLLPLFGCAKDEAPTVDKKAQYETAIKDIGTMVAVVAAYRPYIERKAPTGKFAVKRRPDIDKANTQAANFVRSACNRARQKAQQSTSAVSKELAAPLISTLKACTNAEEPKQLKGCSKAIDDLDKSLAQAATQAKAAGVTTPFPRVAKEYINAKAKAEVAPFLKAIGDGPKEKVYFLALADAKRDGQSVIGACETAKAETDMALNEVKKVSEDLRKLAVHHKYAIEVSCNKLKVTASTIFALSEKCDLKNKASLKSPECMQHCSKAKGILNQGIPAAAFVSIEQEHKDRCDSKAAR